jgi:hypothetical protein
VIPSIPGLMSVSHAWTWFLLDHGWVPSRIEAVVHRFRRHHDDPASRPCIERLAADLRRLSDSMLDPAPASAIRRGAVTMAYDRTLGEACTALGIRHYLDDLTGLDHELERLLAEGRLEAAGLVIRRPAR